MKHYLLILISFFAIACQAQKEISELNKINVREGFKLSLISDQLQSPRFMQMSENKVLYVSLPREGKIKALRDSDGDGYYEKVSDFVEGHNLVHGMQWKDGWLWFAETGAILKARDKNNDGKADEKIEVIKKGRFRVAVDIGGDRFSYTRTEFTLPLVVLETSPMKQKAND